MKEKDAMLSYDTATTGMFLRKLRKLAVDHRLHSISNCLEVSADIYLNPISVRKPMLPAISFLVLFQPDTGQAPCTRPVDGKRWESHQRFLFRYFPQ